MTSNSKIEDLSTLATFLRNTDNSVDNFYISDIPEVCKKYPCVLGIDEAGRGPVLGPMVYGTAFCPINEMTLLDKLECADSKVLNEEKRDEIFENICKVSDTVGWAVEVISPNTISNHMLSRSKYSLNKISMDAAVKLIKSAIESGVNVAHIYVDTVGSPQKYQSYLEGLFPKHQVTVEKKADSTYAIVSMASICAKVTRDHALKGWVFSEGLTALPEQYGSGYPNDPATKKFLIENCDPVFGYSQLVRFSWSTARDAMKESYVIDGEEIEESGAPSKHVSVSSFFRINPKPTIKRQHKFFSDRCLSRDVEF